MIRIRIGLIALLGLLLPLGMLRAADPAPSPPDAGEVQLQRTLDQPFDLKLDKVALSEAFKQIAETAKIRLQIDPACYRDLPYGETTRVSADFRQSKLRDAIEEVLVPLGLQQAVSGSTVMIRPSGPLARIGRKAEWEELKLLQDLRTTEIKRPANGGEFDWTAALRAALNREGLIVTIANPDNQAAHDKAMEQLKKLLPMTAFRALETYGQLTNQIWFAETGLGVASATATIHIMSERTWINRQLDRPIQLEEDNVPLQKVVEDLTNLSGIRMVPEPGLYLAVPAVRLNSNHGSVIQTLEALAGATKIKFEVRDDSILLTLAGSAAAAPPARPDAYIGRISLPVSPNGPSLDLFLHESDLPPELNALRKKKLDEAIEALKKAWTAPLAPPVPETEPATNKAGAK